MAKQYVFNFKDAYGLGKELLGGKGAGLAEMTHIGVPIPEGFTISTEACTLYYESGKKLPDYLVEQIYAGIARVEKETGKNFGGSVKPLLVSVRSGARVSMPGMMDTILNLGLNETTVAAMIKETGNERFAWAGETLCSLCFHGVFAGHPDFHTIIFQGEFISVRGNFQTHRSRQHGMIADPDGFQHAARGKCHGLFPHPEHVAGDGYFFKPSGRILIIG